LVDAASVGQHLRARYGIEAADVSVLDSGVFRIARDDGPDWVTRVFEPPRDLADVEADADILRRLERAGFPAERCATDEPVSSYGDATVLVTEYVEGVRPDGRGRTFAVLGALLGRLHARPGTDLRPGGGWHHLAPRGTPADEIDAARALLDDVGARATSRERAGYERLRALVDSLDPCSDLPHAFVHPDFVPSNAIRTPEEKTIILDWTNAGRGPRLWSIGFLLWAGGARDLRLVDLVVSRYRRHTQLTDEELDRLPGAIRARALMIDCWSIRRRRTPIGEVVRRASGDRELSERISARARARFAEPLG
jgi:Ser/Thr protein kinase RdoA (MazF antagonist)